MESPCAGRARRHAGPGRPRSMVADRAILRAALEVFVERGIDGASIEEIAARAGVARTTVYRRWSNRERLIAQAIASARGAPELRHARGPAALSDVRDALIDALARTLTTPGYMRMAARLIGSIPTCPELMRVYWTSYMLPRRKVISDLLRKARDERLIQEAADLEIILDIISGAIVFQLLVRPGERSVRFMRSYLKKVLDQIGLGKG